MTETTTDEWQPQPIPVHLGLGRAPYEPAPGQVWFHRTPHWRVEVVEIRTIGRIRTVLARRDSSDTILDPTIESFMYGYWPEAEPIEPAP